MRLRGVVLSQRQGWTIALVARVRRLSSESLPGREPLGTVSG